MRKSALLAAALCLGLGGPTACKKPFADARRGTAEHIDEDEKALVGRLQPARDPTQEEIDTYRLGVRQAYNARRFDELDTQAAQARTSRALFGNGSWKIVQFYEALGCRDDEPESMWQLHDQIHQAWTAARPESITARVAHANFQTDYAWHARGNGYADSVKEEGWKLFGERLAAAQKILVEARRLPDKDPVWWRAALRVALGAGIPRGDYDRLAAEAVAYEPKFWGYDTARSYSLLPRWYGQAGDWEAYADAAAKRPDGLGTEAYARIVINLSGYYDNVFRETQASWLQTRDGLALMRKQYPDSLEILSVSAKLATLAENRELAKELFDQLGDRYLPDVWRKPERFVHYRHWARTGRW